MKLKELLVYELSPLLLFLLKRNLMGLKPLFLSENESLKAVLSEKGFHRALCAHPSIVFGTRKNEKGNTAFLRFRVAFLKKSIKIGLLKGVKGHQLMQEFGIQPCFGRGVAFWLEESYSPVVPYHLPEVKKPEGKVVVYSALTGDYDEVHEILYKEDGVDYILFTNNKSLKSKTWQVVQVKSDLDNQLLSREIKMLPHKYLGKTYDLSIYIDANAVIYGEITELTRYFDDKVSFAVSKHGERKSVREEIEAIHRLKGIELQEMRQQYERYVKDGFNDDMGLAECTILLRRHNDEKLKELMECWWKEFNEGVRRDQISLLPCIRAVGFEDYCFMDGYVRHNQYCRIVRHKR